MLVLPSGLARRLGRAFGAPLRRVATTQPAAVATTQPAAVEDPGALGPDDVPGLGARLLVLYDGECGICLHGRDLLVRLDRRGALAHDTIQRHAGGLLAAVDPAARLETWHVVLPSGERLERGAGLAAVLSTLPATRPLGAAARHAPRSADRAYRAFAARRVGISRWLGLQHHPDRLGSLPD